MNDYYLFLGKEEGLKNEAVNTVIKKTQKIIPDIQIKKIYANDKKDIAVFINALNEVSLFGEEFLYIVYNTETAGDINLKKIASILKTESDNNRVVIFLSDENRIASTEFDKLFTPDHKKIFYEMFENQKIPFIINEAKKRNLIIDNKASELLLSLIENTTNELRNALDEIRNNMDLSKDRQINKDVILSTLSHSKEENGFTIAYHIARKNKAELLMAVQHFLSESNYILQPLFSSLLFSLLRAESVLINREQGITGERAFTIKSSDGSETTIRSPFEKTAINAFISNYKRKDISRMIKQILETEYLVREYDSTLSETLLTKMFLSLF
ncbi:MAG: hypothetical protein PUI45_03485 [Spirochaetales bacterium]|nr:hypothetical protein [Spirochaetales bacterium]